MLARKRNIMAIRDKLKATLSSSGPMCDDCLSSSAFVKPRQTVNARCRELEVAGELIRKTDQCPQCKATKIVNQLLAKKENMPSQSQVVSKYQGSLFDNTKPWYWEGNVQEKIIEYLMSSGWEIVTSANTATREAGKDIVAAKNGKELWVSVKGWPEKSQNTQARHWFSGALFDLVLYRDLDPIVLLAIGVPGGFSTYNNLLGRVRWLRENLPFEIIMVSEEGNVKVVEASDLEA
jgi:hypothetical protein